MDRNEILNVLYSICDVLGVDDEHFGSLPAIATACPNLETAAQLIANAVVERMPHSDPSALKSVAKLMADNAGWLLEDYNITLWTRSDIEQNRTLVVWLGNERDPMIYHAGEAMIP